MGAMAGRSGFRVEDTVVTTGSSPFGLPIDCWAQRRAELLNPVSEPPLIPTKPDEGDARSPFRRTSRHRTSRL